MGNFISTLVYGVSYGLVLFLVATGMTLTMGLLRVVNMSHGAIYLFAGYFGVWVYGLTGNWILSLLSAAVAGGLLGLLIETAFLRRLYKTPANQVLLTIGFIHILGNVVMWIWGGYAAGAPVTPFLSQTVHVGSVDITYLRFFIIIFGVVLAAILWFVQEKTKIGSMVRAGMDNGEIAGTLGLNNKKIFTFVFVLGSTIAGLTSIVGGSLTGLNMVTGWNVLLNSIIVVVVGGAGSIQGALLGGLLLGVVNAFGQAYFPGFAAFLFYLVLIVILVIRPQGLMGRKIDVNKASDDYANMRGGQIKRRFNPTLLSDATGSLKAKLFSYKYFPYAIILVVLIVLPIIVGKSGTSIMTKVLVYALFAMSLDVIMGYTGNRSFGHAAFFGMGAYVVGLLFKFFGITSFWVALPVTIVVCALLSAIIGYFTLKLSGTNFLLVTMAFGQLLGVIAQQWYNVTGGADGITGIPRPGLGFATKWNDMGVYFFTLIIFLICFIILSRIVRSSFGHTLKGIKGNEGRMRSLGYNTWSLKYTGVIIAGVFAGIAGLLYAYSYRTVTPSIFMLESSALPMLMVIMGGGATLWGPALGAAVIVLVQHFSGILMPARWPIVLGGLYVLCVMFLDGGFAPHLRRLWDWVGYNLFKRDLNAEPVSKSELGEETKI